MKKLINDLPWNTKLKILTIAKRWTQAKLNKIRSLKGRNFCEVYDTRL